MFDPSSSPFSPLWIGNWAFFSLPLCALSWAVFCKPVGIVLFFTALVNLMNAGVVQYTSGKNSAIVVVMLLSLFLSILWWNEAGQLPYSFGATTHLSVNVSLGMPLFVAGVLSVLITSGWKKIVCHIVPYGAPFALAFVLVLVETVSFVIRPLTLSLRLTGNIVTGHLLLALLCEFGSAMMFGVPFSSLMSVVVSGCLILFEMAVSAVQATIFTILVLMYWTE